MRSTFAVTCIILVGLFYKVEPAWKVDPTKGIPWPLPSSLILHDEVLTIRPSVFNFKIVAAKSCRILNEAVNRYSKIIDTSLSALKSSQRYTNYSSDFENVRNTGYLDTLKINFTGKCESIPYLRMLENYTLEVNSPQVPDQAILSSNSVWGILRGLETFSQLIVPSDNYASLEVRSVSIKDGPRFPHRGLLIDTARHFLPVNIIKQIIDAMEYNKMNVLHWHIVDDESFPYQSELFPDLSDKGAFDSRLYIYSINEIQNIINYASLRGVRVIPEFDTPGHTLSWGLGRPDLLTKCYDSHEEYGPIDPSNDNNYYFIKQLFKEVVNVFVDNYLHLGGDEVFFDCWKSNPNITRFMQHLNITGDYPKLESYYFKRIIDVVHNELKTNTVVWQEAFDNHVEIFPDTIVQIWQKDYKLELAKVTKAGFKALLSSCWYLDNIDNGGDWLKYYSCEPLSFNGTVQQKSLVLGGEACMWGEVVDETNVVQRIWPRTSAVAEKLWSPYPSRINITVTAARLEEQTCRMRRRGIPAQPPNGPSMCIL